MTLPRRFLPAMDLSLCRRTTRRCLFLKPTRKVTGILLYALGVALEDNELVELYAMTACANHYHMVVRDLSQPGEVSQIADFMGQFNSLTARALNVHYGRGENLWSAPETYHSVEIWNQLSLESQLLYAWTNCVRDGMVPRPELWPGITFLPEDFGTTRTIPKPEGAFFGGRGRERYAPGDDFALADWRAQLAAEERAALDQARERDREKALAGRGVSKKRRQELIRQRRNRLRRERLERQKERAERSRSTLPDEVTISIGVPRGEYEGWPLEEVRRYFRELLEEELKVVHATRLSEGKTRYMGVEAVLAQDPRDSAGSVRPTFARVPVIACKGDPAARYAILEELVSWRIRYRQALEERRRRLAARAEQSTRWFSRSGPTTSTANTKFASAASLAPRPRWPRESVERSTCYHKALRTEPRSPSAPGAVGVWGGVAEGRGEWALGGVGGGRFRRLGARISTTPGRMTPRVTLSLPHCSAQRSSSRSPDPPTDDSNRGLRILA